MTLARYSCRVALAILFSHALCAQAQSGAGVESSLSGTVRDPSGAAIVGAHLLLKEDAGKVRNAQTDREGAYHFQPLRPGITR